jgi:dienelactone hydrolase
MCSRDEGCGPDAMRRTFLAGSVGLAVTGFSGAARTPTELHLYDRADQGFLAYARPPRYDAAAGALSWQRTTAFLNRTLPRAG